MVFNTTLNKFQLYRGMLLWMKNVNLDKISGLLEFILHPAIKISCIW